ncbi:Sodium/hydrogen exchanger isoform 1 [Hibiscus syriacus]|uniref:Sodium/hydrogen exchanger isoform 1 n=1 Tax=Hibiscus syriacus TaxID=106335 RepID=A0A6A3BWK8_HIBSY|nr:Sodium/hydrogen exchanger isoform 1 [Hibiscus syriacus]
MVQMMSKMENSRWWWFDTHHDDSKRSQWLQSTVSGAPEMSMSCSMKYMFFYLFYVSTFLVPCFCLLFSLFAEMMDLGYLNDKDMLKLIEEDSDSFAELAEMYYKKRPELISMVEDFYRSHRLLAKRYDQIKSDP